MSSETRQWVEEALVLSPWVVFLIVLAWCWVLEQRDNVRAARERQQPRRERASTADI